MNLLKLAKFTSLGIKLQVPKEDFYPKDRDLSQKFFVVTGANSGIGYETTKILLQMKANVIIICRSQSKMNEAVISFEELGSGKVYPLCYDLSDLSQIESLTQDILNISKKIDSFVHNAGVLLNSYQKSPQGIEATFALMTMAPFQMTKKLVENVEKFIWVSSGGMYGTSQNLNDVNYENRKYDGVMAYAESKRNQVDMAQAFAKKYPYKQFFSMHPGWVDTPGVQKSLPLFRKITKPFLRNYYQGCDTVIYLAVEKIEKPNGSFWFDRKVAPFSLFKKGRASSAEELEKLWDFLRTF